MHRATRTCIAASALALVALATSCGEAPTAPGGANEAAPGGMTEAAPGGASDPGATTAPAGDVMATGPEAVARVRERAKRLWEAKLTEDWATVYEIRDPAVRDEGTQAEYVAWSNDNEPFRIEGYEIGEVLTEDGVAWVRVAAQISTRQFESPARDVDRWDKWRLIEGDDWYPVPQKMFDHYPVAPPLRDREAEERLRERFMLSWEARKTRDWPAYLDLYAPSDREIMTLDEFVEVNEMFIYDDVDVLWIEVVDDHGKVRVGITERVTDPSLSKMPPTLAISTETWKRVDGEWYAYLGLAQRSDTEPPRSPFSIESTNQDNKNQTRGGK